MPVRAKIISFSKGVVVLSKVRIQVLQAKVSDFTLEAGCDEAGRGCLAGPVTAAAVILPEDFELIRLTDSKQVSEAWRKKLRITIEDKAICWKVAHVWPEDIDRLNILKASILAMHKALDGLSVTPDFIAIDGNKFIPFGFIPYQCEIKGDARFLHIAAASILAKTHRDDLMHLLDQEFPKYGWMQNKGYPTEAHRAALREFGPTPYHRKTFKWT
jgi:ribonuclease HII